MKWSIIITKYCQCRDFRVFSHADLKASLKAVHVGEAAQSLKLAVKLEKGDMTQSAVVELDSGDCLTLCFPSSEERDRFAICMRIFAAAPG